MKNFAWIPHDFTEISGVTKMYGQSLSTKFRFDGSIFTVHQYFGLFCLNIPLNENYIDFSNGKDTTLISKNIDWGDWWFKKSTVRYNKLDKDNQLASEILFHERIPEDEIEMWLSVAGKH